MSTSAVIALFGIFILSVWTIGAILGLRNRGHQKNCEHSNLPSNPPDGNK